ncbi:MAG: hypothetical protein QOE22_760 [Candidatus Parcubacteria bacterium]|jgi:hypothetical protein|nr:hypothetical protein [Candidatus Parcubacteria bacterium]
MPDIIKADGTIERWNAAKLEESLINSGATEAVAERIRQTIEASLAPSEESREIYRRAFAMLRSSTRTAAARYSLRRALFEFGPTGHPFEDFVGELFKAEGWTIAPRQLIPGKCVTHEVDVYASRGGECLAAELKYHNDPGYKTDIKVALYVKARLDDIWAAASKAKGDAPHVDHGYLITNTKFTSQAVEYASCAGFKLLGWSYPHGASLYDRIVASGLYPVTALTQLKKSEKRLLIEQNIVTAAQVREHRDKLREIAIPPERIGGIVAEIETLSAEG